MKMIGLHLYSILLSLWTGGIFIFTFVVTPVIFRSYGKDMAGEIVGKLFPSYFIFSVLVSVCSLLVFLAVFQDRTLMSYKISVLLLFSAVFISLYVNLGLHPEIRKVKAEIKSFETVSPEDPLRKQFRSLHARSAVLNLLMLADGVALLVISSGLRK